MDSMEKQDSQREERQPSYEDLLKIAKAAIDFHRSLMSDWAVSRGETRKTLKLSDELEKAYLPHWPL